MARKLQVSCRGHCPEIGGTTQIIVTFGELPMSGVGVDYKKLSYRCDYSSEHGCTARGETGADCPLFRAAKPS